MSKLDDMTSVELQEWVQSRPEVQELKDLLLDACEVFDHYDLPEHAFHYRRKILGLEEAKKYAPRPPIAYKAG